MIVLLKTQILLNVRENWCTDQSTTGSYTALDSGT